MIETLTGAPVLFQTRDLFCCHFDLISVSVFDAKKMLILDIA